MGLASTPLIVASVPSESGSGMRWTSKAQGLIDVVMPR